jgi:Cu(I)/Ag(I) efflux system membrane fusion protein
VGQVASASVFALPLMRFEGSVIQVRPDPEAKATQLRVVLADPGLTLRPGMHAEVQIEVALAERLVVPARAIIHAGPRRLAFVDRGGGQLEPRKLEIGAQVDGFVEVRGGLIAGERVVVSGTFLVAAESRIRSRSKLWADEPPAAPPTRVKPAAKPPKPAEQPTRGGTR